MANDKKIEERVSVVEMIEGVFVAQVFDGVTGPLNVGWADTYVGPSKQRANDCKTAILAAIRLACEAMREQCAITVRAECLACGGDGCEYCRHQIAAIQGLEV